MKIPQVPSTRKFEFLHTENTDSIKDSALFIVAHLVEHHGMSEADALVFVKADSGF